MTLAKLLEDARAGAEEMRAAQSDARAASVSAVRAVEAALVEALGGERLRGLPVLHRTPVFAGARARGRRIDGVLAEKHVLVLDEEGRLRMACTGPDGVGVATRPADDSELLAEDVEDVARAAEEVLRRHVTLLAQKAARYRALVELAGKLEAALR